MRSGTTLMPGEVAGCTGCHEDRLTSPPPTSTRAPAAAAQQPSPWYGPQRNFNYLTEVQPVWDRTASAATITATPRAIESGGDLGMAFNTSYVELLSRSPVRWAVEQPGGRQGPGEGGSRRPAGRVAALCLGFAPQPARGILGTGTLRGAAFPARICAGGHVD